MENKLRISDIYGQGQVSLVDTPVTKKVFWKSSLPDDEDLDLDEEVKEHTPLDRPITPLRDMAMKKKPPVVANSSYFDPGKVELSKKDGIEKLRADELGLPKLSEKQKEQLKGPSREIQQIKKEAPATLTSSSSSPSKASDGGIRQNSGSASKRIVITSASSQLSRLTDDMSKQEMFQLVESQKREIKYLQEKVKYLEGQKDQMVDNFKLSSSVLLERLKDLEQFKAQMEQMKHLGLLGSGKEQMVPTERPQTANVLSNIFGGGGANGPAASSRIGPSGANPSTAASSNSISKAEPSALQSSRGFGELGSTKRDKSFTSKMTLIQAELEQAEDEVSSEDEAAKQPEMLTCPNCQKQMSVQEAPAHTVQCYRNSTKCKVCGEVILKEKKKEHLQRWRDPELLKKAIIEDHDELVSLHFDHGMNCNLQFKEKSKVKLEAPTPANSHKSSLPLPDAANENRAEWTPMHFAAENGSLNVVLALVSRGAGLDPTDQFHRTPLMIAIENSNSAIARTLIELGSDVEATDMYGKTPLMYACKVGSKEIVELLLKCKVNISAVTKVGDSAMTMAQKSGKQEIVMLLVRSGVSIGPSSRTRLPSAKLKK